MLWKLFKFVLLYIVLCCPWSTHQVYNPDRQIVNSLNDVTINIMKYCYTELKTIVIHKESNSGVMKTVNDPKINWIVLGESTTAKISMEYRKTMPLFLTTTNSSYQFHQRLNTFKNSQWWSIMAKLFIVDDRESCENAEKVLRTAWNMNVLTVFYICYNSDNQVMVYSYNPYTNRAPNPWKRVSPLGNGFDKWTMYRRQYNEGDICTDLDFDRTKQLDGAVVRVLVQRPTEAAMRQALEYNDTEMILPFDLKLLQHMEETLDVMVQVHFVDSNVTIEGASECERSLQIGLGDVALCLRPLTMNSSLDMSYPVFYSTYTVVTHRVQKKNDFNSCRSTFVVSMALIALVFKKICTTVYEAGWIFFFLIFLLGMGYFGRFFGGSEDEIQQTGDTIDDLSKSKYAVVFTTPEFLPEIRDPLVREKVIVGNSGHECFVEILGNKSVACIVDSHYGKIKDVGLNFVAPKGENVRLLVYSVRKDWPLLERFNIFLMVLQNKFILEKWIEDDVQLTYANYVRNLAG